MWLRVLELAKDGRALLVYQDDSEQGLAFRVHRHHWTPIDLDGLLLMLRPVDGSIEDDDRSALRKGWSSASRRRKGTR